MGNSVSVLARVRFSSYGTIAVSAAVLVLVSIAHRAASAQVYEWTDGRGVRHFSSQRQGEQFRKAELPHIMREKFGSRTALLKGCSEHGGINCQAGADGDGSVICFDGFRDAAARYRFSCATAKLLATEIQPDGGEGSFKVIVRNESSVEALKPLLSLPQSLGTPSVSGPASIAPLQVAEFSVDGARGAPAVGEIQIGCENCG